MDVSQEVDGSKLPENEKDEWRDLLPEAYRYKLYPDLLLSRPRRDLSPGRVRKHMKQLLRQEGEIVSDSDSAISSTSTDASFMRYFRDRKEPNFDDESVTSLKISGSKNPWKLLMARLNKGDKNSKK